MADMPVDFVATHNGVFHADDVFAAATLRLHQPGIEIRRTRDPQVLAGAKLVFDVGGGGYDHHQPGGNGERSNGMPYASFGLIWRDYGSQVCDGDQAVADEVDRLLVQQVDAGDSGVDLAVQKGAVRPVSVNDVFFWTNPSWQEGQEATDFDRAFEAAVQLAQVILLRAVEQARGRVRARDIIQQALATQRDPRIIVLDRYVPWQEAVHEHAPSAVYIVYPSAGSWRVQGVPTESGTFKVRRLLPSPWAGLDNEALRQATGVADATFVHRSLAIAGADSMQGACALAQLSLAKEE
ncbi:MAG TPA: MYG1 family protein [Roseiflexaceae bacterium]|nr:MYG1 family protein [Roseiflexaceae bacterium]